MANTQHIRLKGKQWQFYRKVPSEIRGAFAGRSTIIRNLETGDLLTAQRARDELCQRTDVMFARARRGEPLDGEEEPLSGAPPWKKLEAEALDWRAALREAGNDNNGTGRGGDWDDGDDDESAVTVAEDRISEEAEKIAEAHGYEVAKSWHDIATGKRTPISDDLLDQFFIEEPCARSSQEKRRLVVRRLKKWLGPSRSTVEAITKRLVGQYVTYLSVEKKLLPASVNDHVSSLSAFWKWMTKKGINASEENPWRSQGLSLQKHSRQASSDEENDDSNKVAWTHEEVRSLIDGTEVDDRLLRDCISIAALSGMRMKELTDLKVRHILTEGVNGTALQLFNITKAKTKAGIRKVPVHSQLGEIIARRLKGKGPDEYLIEELNQATSQRPAKLLSFRFTKYSRTLFPQYTASEERKQAMKDFHSLRRYFITVREQAGCNPLTLISVVGHEAPGMTFGLYSEGPSLEQRRECVEAVKLITSCEEVA